MHHNWGLHLSMYICNFLNLLLKAENPYDYDEGEQVWGDPDEVVSVLALQDKKERERERKKEKVVSSHCQRRSPLTRMSPEARTRLWLKLKPAGQLLFYFRSVPLSQSVPDSFPGSCCSLTPRWAEVCRWAPSYFSASLPSSLAGPSSVSVLSPAVLSSRCVTLSVSVCVCECVCVCDCVCVCVCVWCQMRDREGRAVYHEPDGVRHLSEDLGGIRGHRRHPATPQNGVEPGLIHWVDSHTHVIGQILPGGKEKYMSTLEKKKRFLFSQL